MIMHHSNFYFLNIIIPIIIIQLLLYTCDSKKIKGNPDFLFPNNKGDIIFPSDNFNFPKDDNEGSKIESGGTATVEYNLCKRRHQHHSHDIELTCGKYRNTKNGQWWKPKPQNEAEAIPDGYSGFIPHNWKDGVHALKPNGERERRKSERRYKEYIESIFGRGNYDKNKILTPEQLNGREIADPGQFPHVAAIGTRLEDNERIWSCTGCLLSEYFLVTAAHCTDMGGEAPNFVKIGDVNLNVREGVVATQRFRIDKIIVHPNYNADWNYHDIALIKLSKAAIFTKYVHPIRIWPHRDIPYTMAFAMGYGATTFGRIPTGVLSFFNFTLIGNKDCNQSLANIEQTPYGIIDNQICAVNTENSADICQGDSGGPLQLHLPGLERPNYFLIGITSYGLVCGSRLPSVYTRVYSYLEWIEDTIWPD